MWQAKVFTLFPDMFPGTLGQSIAGKALAQKKWFLDIINIRDYATDKHKTVDDTCYGGGAGMVMRPDVVHTALINNIQSPYQLIYVTPRGKPLTQTIVKNLIKNPIAILCGRYEGIDQRVIDYWKKEHYLEEISIGDYVLSGGEIAAQVILDACVRILPGVLEKPDAIANESFELDLLEYPHYTKPQEWNSMVVPDVLLSGDHKHIAAWRLEQAEIITKSHRSDLWKRYKAKEKG